MAQQIVGRAPNILDFLQMRALARRTPKVLERDIEGENRLKIELVKAIADLEKTKADIKKATITGMTDMATKFASSQASMLGALADEAKAQAMTADAKANLIKTVTGEYDKARGLIAAGQPEETFVAKLRDPASGITPLATAMTSALSGGMTGETSQLIAELLPAEGSPSITGPGFAGLVDMLDQQYVTGPGGMVQKTAEVFRQYPGSPQMLAPNAHGAMTQVQQAIASAVKSLPDNVPMAVKEQLYGELSARAMSQMERSIVTATGNPNLLTDYAQTQDAALKEMRAEREQAFQRLSVGIPAKLKSKIMSDFDKITGMLVADDPIAQLQVARDRLAQNGITPPPAGASAEVRAAYEKQLTDAYKATIPMEGFAQRLSTMPASPEIDKQITYLKGLLANVGTVTPDALMAATSALKQSMGPQQFDAWRRMVGAGTDEAAAIAAAQDPTKLSVFRRVAGTEANLLTNPEQYRRVVSGEAANEAAAARQAARTSAREYAAEGQAIVQPQLPSEPAPSRGRVVPQTPEEQAARAASTPAFPSQKPADIAAPTPTKFDVSQWSQGIESALQEQPTLPTVAQGGAMGMAPQPPAFQTALAATTAPRTQLFGAGGLMGQMARGRTG